MILAWFIGICVLACILIALVIIYLWPLILLLIILLIATLIDNETKTSQKSIKTLPDTTHITPSKDSIK